MKSTSSTPFSVNDWSSKGHKTLLSRQLSALDPWFYSRKSIIRIAGSIFAGLTFCSTYKTVHTALWLVDVPSVIKRAVCGYSLLTVYLATSSFFCFRKNEFWNDPVFRATKGAEAAKDIQTNKLGFLAINSKYGTKISAYNILVAAELKELLKNEHSNCKTYQEFKDRNGNENLQLFDREGLTKLILEECRTSSLDSTTLLSSFSFEREKLGLHSDEILRAALNGQIQNVLANNEDYFTFRKRHHRVDLLELKDFEKVKLKKLFLVELPGQNNGVNEIFDRLAEDIKLFQVTRLEIEQKILPIEASKEFDPRIAYNMFKRRNGENSVIRLIKIDQSAAEIMRIKFFGSSFKIMTYKDFASDFSSLGITIEDVDASVRRDISNLSYDEFVKKHTHSIFTDWKFTESDINELKPKLLDKIKGETHSLKSVHLIYAQQIKALLVADTEINTLILPQ